MKMKTTSKRTRNSLFVNKSMPEYCAYKFRMVMKSRSSFKKHNILIDRNVNDDRNGPRETRRLRVRRSESESVDTKHHNFSRRSRFLRPRPGRPFAIARPLSSGQSARYSHTPRQFEALHRNNRITTDFDEFRNAYLPFHCRPSSKSSHLLFSSLLFYTTTSTCVRVKISSFQLYIRRFPTPLSSLSVPFILHLQSRHVFIYSRLYI